jgi:amino acid transporter
MKALIYILIVLALGLIIYNATFLDLENAFSGDSKTALIGILASSIVVVLMVILLMSRAIAKKSGE